MVEPIRIEVAGRGERRVPDAGAIPVFSGAADPDDGGPWEVVVRTGEDPSGRLNELLAVVQRLVDSGDTNAATIRFVDRKHTMGPAFADRPLTRETRRAAMPRRAEHPLRV